MQLSKLGSVGLMALLSLSFAPAAGAFTSAQADAGKNVYDAQCAACHGFRAEGGEAPALSGVDVMGNFSTGAGLYDFFSQTMPPHAPGMLGDEAYVQILARILVLNGAEADDVELTADPDALEAVSLAGLGENVQAAAGETDPDAPGFGRNVPQAYTWGKPLPQHGGGMTEPAAE